MRIEIEGKEREVTVWSSLYVSNVVAPPPAQPEVGSNKSYDLSAFLANCRQGDTERVERLATETNNPTSHEMREDQLMAGLYASNKRDH